MANSTSISKLNLAITETFDQMFGVHISYNIGQLIKDPGIKEESLYSEMYETIKDSKPELFLPALKKLVKALNAKLDQIFTSSYDSKIVKFLIYGLEEYHVQNILLKQLVYYDYESNNLIVDWKLVGNSSQAIFVVYLMIENGGCGLFDSQSLTLWNCLGDSVPIPDHLKQN